MYECPIIKQQRGVVAGDRMVVRFTTTYAMSAYHN